MKNIEIKTTQNVTLEYELADLRDRVLAFILDLLCLGVGLGILFQLGASILASSEIGMTIYSMFIICLFIFYSLGFEVWNNGQSPGKMALRIRVIKTAGGQATFSDYAARWVFRSIDIYLSFGGIAAILVMSSSKAQRIGDIVAHTAVVKLIPKTDLKLRDLLTIHSQDSYTIQYPQAKQLQEEDVLVIKRTLDRSRQFNNAAHHQAVSMLATQIRNVLAIDTPPGNDRLFLQTVLKDYVVSTR